MLIDDNEMDNFINQKVLESALFAKIVYTNTNGLSAYEFLNNLIVIDDFEMTHFPQIIFVDLNMPIINGFQFIEKFYELPKEKTENTKLVILTSSLDEMDRDIAQRLNPEIKFFNKPLTADVLETI